MVTGTSLAATARSLDAQAAAASSRQPAAAPVPLHHSHRRHRRRTPLCSSTPSADAVQSDEAKQREEMKERMHQVCVLVVRAGTSCQVVWWACFRCEPAAGTALPPLEERVPRCAWLQTGQQQKKHKLHLAVNGATPDRGRGGKHCCVPYCSPSPLLMPTHPPAADVGQRCCRL